MSEPLNELLEQVSPKVEARVARTRDRTRSVLQEALRSECRLSMRTPREADEHRAGARVPVNVVPGCPVVLTREIFELDTELVRILAAYRSSLLAMSSGTKKLLSLNSIFDNEAMINQLGRAPIEEMKASSAFADQCLGLLKKKDPIQKILSVDSDVLGEYIYKIIPEFSDRKFIDNIVEIPHENVVYNSARIHLYWAVIGLISGWTGWKVEDLTVVVLTHELAHAYTQLGADIDGRRWSARIFSRTDTALKEGLAQYYTDRVLRRLQHRFDGALDVFEKLTERQTQPYRVHKKWKDNTPEAVRLAMLQARRWRETSLSRFNNLLAEAEDQMRGS